MENQSPKVNRLIDILSVPSFFANEDRMVDKIVSILKEKNLNYTVDKIGNILVTKGVSDVYPCVVAHTDTVHEVCEYDVHIRNDNELFALTKNGRKTGIGGDDKAGVFVCLELLDTFDVVKAAFVVGEEYGCFGSRSADADFFSNVGYTLQFDAPYTDWLSFTSGGVQLFDPNGDFFKSCEPIFEKYWGSKPILSYHPYTDVRALKQRFDFSCINFSVGYYNMHSDREYVKINDCFKALDLAKELIETLGNKKYEFVSSVITEGLMSVDDIQNEFMMKKSKYNKVGVDNTHLIY